MTQPNNGFRVDPYFDGPRGRTDNGQVYDRYKSPDEVVLASGGTASSVIGAGVGGLRGTVIPQSTSGGIPMGTRPHDTANMEVNIDPDIPGQSATVRLGDITRAALLTAEDYARGITPEPTDLESMRLRGAAMIHSIANRVKTASTPAPEPQYQAPPEPAPVPQPQPMQQPQPSPVMRTRRVSPLSAFNQSPQAQARPQQDPYVSQAQPSYPPFAEQTVQIAPQTQAAPPSLTVTFELQHFGSLEARYHDILVENGFIVLVYDQRYQGTTRYFPNPSVDENAPPLALNIAGTETVYLVHTTGLQYVHGDNEYCVLIVDQVGTLPGENDGNGETGGY